MRSLLLVALLIPLLLLTGCAKKPVKNTAPSKDESASAKPQAPKNDKKADEPNWLTDPRFKTEKGEPSLPQEAGPNGKPPGTAPPPQGGWQPGNPGVPPGNPGTPAPPGQGVLQPQPQPQPGTPTTPAPMFSPVTKQDMFDLQVFIHDSSIAMNRMPTQLEIYKALVAAKTPTADLVKNGSIYLTGATTRESVWAFETRALSQGGWMVSQNGVEMVTAAELKSKLGK